MGSQTGEGKLGGTGVGGEEQGTCSSGGISPNPVPAGLFSETVHHAHDT